MILDVPEGDTSIRPRFITDPTKWFDIFYPGNSNESIFELNYDYALYQETNPLAANLLSISSALSSAFIPTERVVEKIKQETDAV